MNKIRAIAIDDEPLALDIIKDYSDKIESLELEQTFETAIEALKYMKDNCVDLIITDIQMPDLNGIDFLKILNKEPFVIFTTAYDKYAIQGYEFKTMDYLLKPFGFDQFYKAINKILEMYQDREVIAEHPVKENSNDFFFVKSEHKIVKIKTDSVLYIEGLKDYLKIVTKEGHILTLMSFRNILELLPQKQFFRVHRSFIVSMNSIDCIEKNRIRIDDKYIPIGDTYKEEFFQQIHV